MVNKNEKLVSLASVLRDKASAVRANREVASKGVFKGAASLVKGLEAYGDGLIMKGRTLLMTAEAARKIINNPTFVTMGERMIHNAIDDLGSRMNELANFLEAVSKDPEVSAAANDLKGAFEDLTSVTKKVSRRLRSVPSDSSGQVDPI